MSCRRAVMAAPRPAICNCCKAGLPGGNVRHFGKQRPVRAGRFALRQSGKGSGQARRMLAGGDRAARLR